MVSKLISFSACVSARIASSWLRRADLVEPAFRRLAIEPGQKAHDGCAVALVRRARTLDLGGVLARLGQDAGIGRAHDARLAALQLAKEPERRRAGIEPDALARLLERRQPRSRASPAR